MAKRGGKRAGAGRKPAIARGLSEAIAKSVFGVYGSESKAWIALTEDCKQRKDAKMLFEILKYWTDRQYGKPAQGLIVSDPNGDSVRFIVEHIGRPQDTPPAKTV